MAANRPDPIVRESEARASVDELTRGLAEDARRAGLLPPMRAIEDVAKHVTAETIARHEDQFRNGVPEKAKAAPVRSSSTARLDQGRLSDDLGEAVKIVRPFDKARHAARAKAVADVREAQMAAKRLALLLSIAPGSDGQAQWVYPEWAERIHKTHRETAALSKNLELSRKEVDSNAADAVLAILDQSVASFGEWRAPKPAKDSPLVFGPKG